MSKEDRELLIKTLNNLCGEADEAARLAKIVLTSTHDVQRFRRSLARIMEIVDSDLLPVLSWDITTTHRRDDDHPTD